jgi:COMPASS component SWD3
MDMVDEQDQRIKEDVIRMIVQYLADEGYSVSRTTLLDEANVKWNERKEKAADIKKLRKVILGKASSDSSQ